ncbi:hypothetical protein ACHAQA_002965 [Verticillium albo-atrum]
MSTPSQRIEHLSAQLAGGADRGAVASLLTKSPNDVVITLAIRTPLTKANKGYLKDTKLEGLLVPLLQNALQKSGIEPKLVEEIVLGNVLHKDASYIMRASGLAAGFPATTAVSTVSRWCSSGLLAVEAVANKVAAGSIDIGIALGAESMSSNPDNGSPEFPPEFLAQPEIHDLTELMPWTSENVARDFGVTRESQDEYAAASFQKAEAAQKAGFTADEIVPITTTWKDPKTGEVRQVVADRDDGVRPGTTKEGLSKIRSAFPQWPPATTTGGNASQITDGAAAVLIMRRDVAERLRQPIIGKFVLSTVAGLAPRIMGIGPTYAIPKLLSKVGISKDDVDIFEINEAFASMLVYCTETLKIDPARLNPRGGAIAFGHPLGCTGARQVVTALAELKRTGGKIAVTSMCVGTATTPACIFIMSAPPPVEADSPPQSKKTRARASKACLVCRRRKVRCNVAITGTPCSNCALDQETCTVPERSHRRWSRQPLHTSAAAHSNRSDARKPRNDHHDHDHDHDDQPTAAELPNIAEPDDDDAAQQTEPMQTELVPTRPPSPIPNATFTDHASPAEASWDRDGPSSWHLFRHNERLFTTTVPISAYPFLTVSNLHRLPPEDVNFLELKNCLRVPSRIYLDEILQQYFRYVHPFFPLVNEALFWDVYHGADLVADNPLPRFPLLVLQAMLFTACSFVSPSTLEQLGYSSVRAARRIMYERAKMLFNFEAEGSRLHMAQAALLLSYWTPPFEEAAYKPNTGWLRVAIENAKSVKAHQWNSYAAPNRAPIEDYEKIALKRLWGCCIIRGGTLAISSRRCCQALGLDSDPNARFSLTYEDLEDEVHESRVYDPKTKKQLIMAFLGLAEICLHVVATSMLLFPFDRGQSGTPQLNAQVEESFRILASTRTQEIQELHDEVQEATAAIGKCFKTLTDLRLARFLPVSVVPCIALPLALNTTNSRTIPSAPKAHIFSEAMNALNTLYEGVDGLAKTVRVIVNQEHLAQPLEQLTLSSNAGYYMRVALSIDLSLSTGKLPDEADLPPRLQETFTPSPETDVPEPVLMPPPPLEPWIFGSQKPNPGHMHPDMHVSGVNMATDDWMVQDGGPAPVISKDADGDQWDLEGLSPRTAEYRILESIIWSSPEDENFQ